MDEAKRKNLGQIAILAVLVVAVIVLAVWQFGKQKAASSTTGGATQAAASKTAATDMAKAGVTPGASSVPSPATANASKLNPNMWKVYALTPPKNPFVQQESWYAATFKKFLPGYPEMLSYFEKPGDVLPNVNSLFGGKINFDTIELRRDFKERTYTLTGTSKDGKMTTVLQAHEQRPDNVDVTYDGHGNKIDKFKAQGLGPGTSGLPPMPNGKTPGTLPPPNGSQAAAGDALGCTGISFHNGHASALMIYNGSSYILNEGGSLPPHYADAHIKENGVELKDTRTGKTRFVELKAASKDDEMPPFMRGAHTVTQS